ncbi:hypothetical protein V494_00371 [Pseudogymnoascus sp. VKM F-4513 (FW-928)]|nr:hypothetical protein V494_00371 [Pseudogymnoascus sp. VKM F-4513 (FW-928)]
MAEVAFVIGLVASVISIIDGVKKVWDATNDPKGQPEAFRRVAARLPLVRSILEKAKLEADKLDESGQEDLEKVLEECKGKVEKLDKIFKKVLPGGNNKFLDRYKAVTASFKGARVEQLMEGILKDAQLIATEKLAGIATKEQVKELADAIKEMNEMPSSLPDETGSVSQMHSGGGHNIANMGPGNTNNIQSGGSGKQYNIAGSAHFGDTTTIHNYANTQGHQKWDPSRGNIHWVIPREVNPNFTGQKELLEEMRIKLCPSATGQRHSRKCFAIIGIGGVGKSEASLNFANTQREKFWGVFWIDASASSTIERGYLDAAQQCQRDASLKIKDFKSAMVFFGNIKHPYLFVLDNADNPEQNLHPYLPTGPGATTIITSRDYKKSYYGTAGSKTLEKLDVEDAIDLLFKASNTPEAHQSEKRRDAEAVVQLLAQHALAIVQAGAYIHQRPCELKEYEEEFQQQKKRPSLLRFRNTEDFSRYGDVYATFEVSAQFLEDSKSTNQAYADALELLGVLGHLYFTGVSQAMFSRAWNYAQEIPKEPRDVFNRAWKYARKVSKTPSHVDDIGILSSWHVSKLPKTLQGLPHHDRSDGLPNSLYDAFAVLRSFGIITIQMKTKDISMHPLAHAWARDRLDETHKQCAWACTISLIALSLKSNREYQEYWPPLQPHIETCIDASPERCLDIYPEIRICQVLYRFAWLFYRVNNYPRCKALAELLRKKLDSRDSISNNWFLIQYLYAICLQSLGEDRPAQKLLEDIVYGNEASKVARSQARLSSKIALASIYQQNGNNKLAISLLQDVVDTRKSILKPQNLNSLGSQHELAEALIRDGKHKEAISILQDVVEIQNSVLIPQDPNNLASQHALATALSLDGNQKKAISIFQDVIKIQKSIWEPEHPECLTSQQELAVALSRDSKLKEAVSLLQDVVKIRKSILKPGDRILLTSQYELAIVLAKDGNYKEALEVIKVVVSIAEAEGGVSDRSRIMYRLMLEDLVIKEKDRNRITPEIRRAEGGGVLLKALVSSSLAGGIATAKRSYGHNLGRGSERP